VLEQRVAGTDGAQVTLEQRQIAGLRLCKQQIEEPPARARGALDQLHILGAKHHGAQHAEIIAQAFDRLAVQRQFAFARRPVDFDFTFAVAGQNFCLPLPARAGRGLAGRAVAGRRRRRGVLNLRNFGLLTRPSPPLGEAREMDGIVPPTTVPPTKYPFCPCRIICAPPTPRNDRNVAMR